MALGLTGVWEVYPSGVLVCVGCSVLRDYSYVVGEFASFCMVGPVSRLWNGRGVLVYGLFSFKVSCCQVLSLFPGLSRCKRVGSWR